MGSDARSSQRGAGTWLWRDSNSELRVGRKRLRTNPSILDLFCHTGSSVPDNGANRPEAIVIRCEMEPLVNEYGR